MSPQHSSITYRDEASCTEGVMARGEGRKVELSISFRKVWINLLYIVQELKLFDSTFVYPCARHSIVQYTLYYFILHLLLSREHKSPSLVAFLFANKNRRCHSAGRGRGIDRHSLIADFAEVALTLTSTQSRSDQLPPHSRGIIRPVRIA